MKKLMTLFSLLWLGITKPTPAIPLQNGRAWVDAEINSQHVEGAHVVLDLDIPLLGQRVHVEGDTGGVEGAYQTFHFDDTVLPLVVYAHATAEYFIPGRRNAAPIRCYGEITYQRIVRPNYQMPFITGVPVQMQCE